MARFTDLARKLTSIGAFAAALSLSSPSRAETLTFKLAHIYSTSHYLSEHFIIELAKAIEAESHGEMKFDIFPSGQLGKDVPALVGSGVVDIGFLPVSVYPQKFPLTSVSELPGEINSSCSGTSKLWSLVKPGGILDSVEYRPQNLHVVAVGVTPPYYLFTQGRKVEKPSDINGLKIRTSGPAMDGTVTELGGVSLKIVPSEIYDAVIRGTLDGVMLPYSSMAQYDLMKRLNHVLDGVPLGGGAVFFVMSAKKWNALSEKNKQIFTNQAVAAQKAFCQWADDNQKVLQEEASKLPGFSLNQASATDKAAFTTLLKAVANEWAGLMEKNGRKGDEVLKAFREAE